MPLASPTAVTASPTPGSVLSVVTVVEPDGAGSWSTATSSLVSEPTTVAAYVLPGAHHGRLDAGRAVDDVVVGDDLAVGGQDHAGAGGLAVLVAERRHRSAPGRWSGSRSPWCRCRCRWRRGRAGCRRSGGPHRTAGCWRCPAAATRSSWGVNALAHGVPADAAEREHRRGGRDPGHPARPPPGEGRRRLDRLRCLLARHCCGLLVVHGSSTSRDRRSPFSPCHLCGTCASPYRTLLLRRALPEKARPGWILGPFARRRRAGTQGAAVAACWSGRRRRTPSPQPCDHYHSQTSALLACSSSRRAGVVDRLSQISVADKPREPVVGLPMRDSTPCCGNVPLAQTDLRRGIRAVAQLGSALDWGSRGRRFKSCQPDQSALICSRRSGPLSCPGLPARTTPSAGLSMEPITGWLNHHPPAEPAGTPGWALEVAASRDLRDDRQPPGAVRWLRRGRPAELGSGRESTGGE